MTKREKLEVTLVLIEEIGADLEDKKEQFATQVEASRQCLDLAVMMQKKQEDIVRQFSGKDGLSEDSKQVLLQLDSVLKRDSAFTVKAMETSFAESRSRLELTNQILDYMKKRRTVTEELYKSAKNTVQRRAGKRS